MKIKKSNRKIIKTRKVAALSLKTDEIRKRNTKKKKKEIQK